MEGALERLDGRSWASRAELRVTAGHHPAARIEHVLAQHDVLTGDILLVRAATVVTANDTAVRRRSLRPVDPAVLERELLRGMVAGRQSRNERGDLPRLRVDGHNA